MVELPEVCIKAFENVLTKLIENKWRSSVEADDLLEQYKCFLELSKKEHEFEFKNCTERVDIFLHTYMSDKQHFEVLWRVFKLLLTIGHSQSSVEKGFSVNTDVAAPNLKDETLISLRTVYDGINAMNIDLTTFVVPKELVAQCRYKKYFFDIINVIKDTIGAK